MELKTKTKTKHEPQFLSDRIPENRFDGDHAANVKLGTIKLS